MKIYKKGAIELMNSPSMQNVLREHTRDIAGRAGQGFYSSVQTGKTRAHGRVRTGTAEAAEKNQRENTLLKALGGRS
ncbi:MAG: hypothetical protein MSS97_06205 [Arcanobacterium sp.]|nr:hypothetical protein [Arcanobacterium sp.]